MLLQVGDGDLWRILEAAQLFLHFNGSIIVLKSRVQVLKRWQLATSLNSVALVREVRGRLSLKTTFIESFAALALLPEARHLTRLRVVTSAQRTFYRVSKLHLLGQKLPRATPTGLHLQVVFFLLYWEQEFNL